MRADDSQPPLFAVAVTRYDDGGTTDYRGLLYQVVQWKQLAQNSDGQNGFLVGTEWHGPFSIININDGPAIPLKFVCDEKVKL